MYSKFVTQQFNQVEVGSKFFSWKKPDLMVSKHQTYFQEISKK